MALVLGTLIAFAIQRFRFFGREALSFAVVLPIALPGIVTGVALDSAFRAVLEPLGVGLGLFFPLVRSALVAGGPPVSRVTFSGESDTKDD